MKLFSSILICCCVFFCYLDAKKEKEVVWCIEKMPIQAWHPGMKIKGVNDSETLNEQSKEAPGDPLDRQDEAAAE